MRRARRERADGRGPTKIYVMEKKNRSSEPVGACGHAGNRHRGISATAAAAGSAAAT